MRFYIGLNDEGEEVYGDFNVSGSFLSTGSTGSGHASFDEGAFVTYLIQNYTSDSLKFVMIDTKQLQLLPYEDIPHLWRPVAYRPDDAKNVINELIDETNRRYDLFSSQDAKNLEEYNDRSADKLPVIILFIPEIVDLMMVDREFYEKSFVWLTQRARMVGIHLYISTQNLNENMLSDVLLARLPGRLVFGTTTAADSERLLGTADAASIREPGRLLFADQVDNPTQYVTANYVTDAEVADITENMIRGAYKDAT